MDIGSSVPPRRPPPSNCDQIALVLQEAALSALIRRGFMKVCMKPGLSRAGLPVFPSAASTARSSPGTA